MPQQSTHIDKTSSAYPLSLLVVGLLAGVAVGTLAGSVLAVRTVQTNVIGLTADSIVLGAYLALVYGLVFAVPGLILGAVFAGLRALGRSVGTRLAFAGSFGIVLALYLFLTGMRVYNQDIYFYEYPFIHSYRGMVAFFAVRSVVIALVAAAVGYGGYRLSRRAPRRMIAGLAVLIVAAGLVTGFSSTQPGRRTTTRLPAATRDAAIPKVLLIGWDGATWRVMDRLLDAGLMPNTKHLIERGTAADLKTLTYTVSPDIWTTIYTGKLKAKHGIYGFDYYTVPGISRSVVPVCRGLGIARILGFALKHGWIDVMIANRSLRRALPIWRIMNDMGRTAGVVSPLVTWPAEEVEPFLITDTSGDVAAKMRRTEIDREAFCSGDLFYPADLEAWVIDEILARKRWQASVGTYLYRKHRPDFFTIYFNQPDGTQHIRWKWMEPEYYSGVTEEDLARYGGAIEYEYVRADSILGHLLDIAGDSTVVVIVSDHGFSPTYQGGIQQAGHYHGPDGILIACGPHIVPGAEIAGAHVRDITPTLLALAGLPVAEDMDGRVLEELIDPEFLRSHPVRTTLTYEGPESGMKVRRTQVEQELYQRLRALGYVGQ